MANTVPQRKQKNKTQQASSRRVIRKLLIGITVTVVILAVLVASSGGYGPVFVLIALPFIIIGLFVIWGVYVAWQSLSRSISSKKSGKVSSSHALLARWSITLLAVGAFLLGWFIVQGGPHNASGGPVLNADARHILGGSSNPYMDMQAGIALLILGTLLSLIHHFLIKPSGKTR